MPSERSLRTNYKRELWKVIDKLKESTICYIILSFDKTRKDTTKVRVASAKGDGGQSLNSCLYTGLKFDQLRFRYLKLALTADIEKAFLMVSVAENDRDVLRLMMFLRKI